MGTPAAGDHGPAWLNARTIAVFVLVVSVARLWVGSQAGLASDEGYYTFWSEHLAIGYLDHPPAVAFLIAAGRLLFGNSELGVRAMTVVCTAITSAAIWRLGALLLDRRTAALAVVLFNLAPPQAIGFLTTPDAPSMTFWTLALWAVAEFSVSGRRRWWLVAGLAVGLGLWSKYTVAFLPPGLLLYLLASRERRAWLRLPAAWGGLLLALLVFAPVIWWNAQHDWASFRYQGQRMVADQLGQNFVPNVEGLFIGFAGTLGPIVMLFAFGGMIVFFTRLRDSKWQRLALLVWTSLPALGYFIFHCLHGGIEINWPTPLWPALILIGSAMLSGLWRRLRWLALGLVGIEILLDLAAATILIGQILPWQPFALGGNDRTHEMRDWRPLVADIQAIAKANGARWIATSRDYALTGELAAYLLFAGSPLHVHAVDEPIRWLFQPPLPGEDAVGPALYVAGNSDPPTQFATARLVGTSARRDRYGVFASYWMFLVDGPPAAAP